MSLSIFKQYDIHKDVKLIYQPLKSYNKKSDITFYSIILIRNSVLPNGRRSIIF